MKRTYLIFALIFIASFAFSQNEIDALRYSQIYYGGTARFVATGSSFGALGGDLSTLATNPAGLGIYRKGEINFTPGFITDNSTSSFNGNQASDRASGFVLNNIGVVLSIYDASSSSDWKSVNLGFAYNRFNNFASNTYIEGISNSSSMLDYFMHNADGNTTNSLNSFSEYLAWDTYLLDETEENSMVYLTPAWWYNDETGNYVKPNYGQTVTKTIEKKGGSGEYDFSIAANYNDFFYFGATIGLQSFTYSEATNYSETNINQVESDSTDLESFSFTENLDVSGSGVNFKLGIIIRPFDFVRIGGAFHTPTYYSITDRYFTTMNSSFTTADDNGYSSYTSLSPNNEFQYELTTPLRLIGNIGFVISKFALLSAEYEYVDYSTARLSTFDYNFVDENNSVKNTLASTFNIRTGLELKFGPLSLRGGYAMYGNPYKTDRTDASRTQITGGFGISSQHIYVDFAYVHTLNKDSYFLYNYIDDNDVTHLPEAKMSFTNGVAMATLGLRF